MQTENRCSRGVASHSPRRLRTAPSKPTYVPVTEIERRAARDTSAVSKWDLLRGTPLPAAATAAGLLRVGVASAHASVAIRSPAKSPAKGASRSPDIRREPPLSPHATVI